MNSLILRTATRGIITLLLLFAVFMLVLGHNAPGGGFIAGLVASAAILIYTISFSPEEGRRLLHVEPVTLIAAGLVVAIVSGLIGLVTGEPFLTGVWVELGAGPLPEIDLGTPLLFDLGVFLVVVGVTVLIMAALEEAE
jgi:multisubunit Na+/H+ antiporter MnhB subunit